MEYPTPIATVDIVLLVVRDGVLQVGLLRRAVEPFAGRWALPGGFVHTAEDRDLAGAATRVLREKLGLVPRYLEQLSTQGGPARDPRGWSISVAYYVLLDGGEVESEELVGASPGLRWVAADAVPALPFDHAGIVAAAVRRLRGKATYSSLPAFLLPPAFTFAELHRVYEQVIGTRLDLASFRRKIMAQGIIEAVAGGVRAGAHRPAQLYRLAPGVDGVFDRRL